MPREGIFAIVKRGGTIKIGDDVVVHDEQGESKHVQITTGAVGS